MLEIARSGDGALGCMGLDHSALQDQLGLPTMWGPEDDVQRAHIWRYGDIEFHFHDWKVCLICSDHGELTDGGESLTINPWVVNAGLPLSDFEKALKDHSIEFEKTSPVSDPSMVWVVTQESVKFTFAQDSDSAPMRLAGWSLDR